MGILAWLKRLLTGAGDQWEPEITMDVPVRLRMRKRDARGKWIYRAPTPEEELRFRDENAW